MFTSDECVEVCVNAHRIVSVLAGRIDRLCVGGGREEQWGSQPCVLMQHTFTNMDKCIIAHNFGQTVKTVGCLQQINDTSLGLTTNAKLNVCQLLVSDFSQMITYFPNIHGCCPQNFHIDF